MNFKELENHLDRILGGKERFISNPHDRLREVFNLYKSRYILVGSNSGTGKTSFVDDSLLLKPYDWLMTQDFNYHYEVKYWSMERSIRDKIAKFTSWKIYQDKGIKIPSNVFSVGAHGNMKLTPEIKHLAKQYQPWLDEFLSKVDIVQGPRTVAEIQRDIEEIAVRICDRLFSDANYIYINNKKLAEFDPNKFKLIKGVKVPYRTVTIHKEVIDITPNSYKYVLKNPNTFVFLIGDHIGKTKLNGYSSKKAAIDDLDEVVSVARDNYYMSPIMISQFNRAIGEFGRIKFANGDLSPTTDDFKDTNNAVESADLILSIFDPYRYKSYNKEGIYAGYNIADGTQAGTLSPSGDQRFRSLHILKNSYGSSQLTYGLRFTGEVMDFKLLPLPGTQELERVYEQIAQGK